VLEEVCRLVVDLERVVVVERIEVKQFSSRPHGRSVIRSITATRSDGWADLGEHPANECDRGMDAGWNCFRARSKRGGTLCDVTDAAHRGERELSDRDLARLEAAHRELVAVVKAYERFRGGDLEPGQPVPVHEANEMRVAQEAVEAA